MTKDKSLHLTPKQLGLEGNPMIKDADPLASDSGKAPLPWEQKGKFTCGAKYICFLPEGSFDYIRLAAPLPGGYDSEQWNALGTLICEALNKGR